MTNQKFDLDTPCEEIALHLKEDHCYEFDDRRSLKHEEFIEEHFPDLVKYLQDKKLQDNNKNKHYLLEEGREKLEKINRKIRSVLSYCEENGIPIIRVFKKNENGEGEWRICKPTVEDITYLLFRRWYAMIEGLTNKSLLQANLIEEKSLDEIL